MRKSDKTTKPADRAQELEAKRQRVRTDPDFINASNYDNSLKKFRDSNPQGIDEDRIVKYLMLAGVDELETHYQSGLAKLREYLQLSK